MSLHLNRLLVLEEPDLSCSVSVSAGDYAGFPGCGLLRLHSTYRHDLKIYASDEGRVQMTAAAFAKVRLHSPALLLWRLRHSRKVSPPAR